MPSRPLVSVITPTLNQARYLERTLDSVRTQTYPAIEHVVVDGGSTDGTLGILRREAERGSLRFVSEPDRGMYDAVNKGLALATGDVLAYLNSDDAYLPWALEAVIDRFEALPAADLVYGDGLKVEEETGIQRLRLFPPFDLVSLASYESLMQPAVFWRRRLYERIGGFDAGLRFVADLDYWLRAAGAGATIAHLDEVIAVERIHAARLSSAQRDAMAAEGQEMRRRHAGPGAGPAARKRAVARHRRWQRRLWLRFLAASVLRRSSGPWHRFLREGAVRVRPGRALRWSLTYRYGRLRNAVVSALAAEVIGPHASPANGGTT